MPATVGPVTDTRQEGMLARTHEGKPGLPRGQGRSRLPLSVVRASQRERLLRSVIAAVAEAGYPAVTIANIVRRARVSRAAFSLTSRTGRTIVSWPRPVRQLMITRIVSATRALPAGAGDEEVLRAACRAYLTFLADEPAFARVFFIFMPAAGAARGRSARCRAPPVRRPELQMAPARTRAPPAMAGRPRRGVPRSRRGHP